MQFYDVKNKEKVDIAEASVTKKKFTITTKTGKEMIRFAFIGKLADGRTLTKFCSQEDYTNTQVPEVA